MIEELLAVIGGIAILSPLLGYMFYSVYRKFLIFHASEISREIQGLDGLPKPPLKDLVKLLDFLVLKREEIEKVIEEKETEQKYDNTYQ